MRQIPAALVHLANVVVCLSVAQASAGHALTIDDVLRMENVGRVLIAPGGRYLVFERVPPYREAPNLGTFEGTDTSALSKLLVADLNERADSRPLFEQRSDGGYWLGGFSPDGSKLAVYSLIEGKVTAGVFDFPTRALTTFQFTPNYSERLIQKPIWTSENELIYAAMPDGRQPSVIDRVGIAARLNELWQTAFEGTKPSTTVVTSSVSGIEEADVFQAGSLVRANSTTGGAVELASGYFYNLRLSPDGRYLAALKRGGRIQFGPDEPPSRFETTRHQLIVLNLADSSEAVPCPRCNVSMGTVDWSADGQRLTFFAHAVGKGVETAQLFQYTPVSGALEKTRTGAFWFACGSQVATKVRAVGIRDRVAVFGRLSEPGDRGRRFHPSYCRKKARHDWFLIGSEGEPVNLTRAFADVSGDLVGVSGDALFVLADGGVWRVEPSGSRRKLTASVKGPLTSWSVGLERVSLHAREEIWTGTRIPTTHTVLQSADRVMVLDLKTEGVSVVDKPARNAQLLAITDSAMSAVFREDSRSGSTVLLRFRRGSSRPLVEINQHLRGVAEAKQVRVSYRLPGGDELSSCLLLPPDWTPAKRYPLVVHVYPGHYGDCDSTDLSRFDPYNYQLLAARQYIVLFAAAPRSAIRTPVGPTGNLTTVVLAAVDRVIQDGYADADRMGVFGISQGHQSALQVITETNRFKAAIAMLGTSNASSHYGTVPLRYRLGFGPGDFPFLGSSAGRYEGWGPDHGLGAKPWEDPLRYVRNSPVFHADKIETPLLIVHSDFDDFPLGQSEEIFSALYRLRKEAVYVTYWGEGHGMLSPANIRDMWERIFRWFNERLQVRTQEGDS